MRRGSSKFARQSRCESLAICRDASDRQPQPRSPSRDSSFILRTVRWQPEKGWSRLDRHRYAREWAHRSRVRALKYWSTLYRSNKARRQEEHGETIREKSYYLAMHDRNRPDWARMKHRATLLSQVFFAPSLPTPSRNFSSWSAANESRDVSSRVVL